MCSCADTIQAASSPASGTVGQNVPGGSGADTTLIINLHHFLLHAARHKYFPTYFIICFLLDKYVCFDVYEMSHVTTEDHLPGGWRRRHWRNTRIKMAEILMHFIWQLKIFHKYLSSYDSGENIPLPVLGNDEYAISGFQIWRWNIFLLQSKTTLTIKFINT